MKSILFFFLVLAFFSCEKEQTMHSLIQGEWIDLDKTFKHDPNCDRVRITTNTFDTPQLIVLDNGDGTFDAECSWQHFESKAYYFTFAGNVVNKIMLAGVEKEIWFVGDTLRIGIYPWVGTPSTGWGYVRP